MIKNLDIYFSNACNMNCSYCCMKDNLPNINNNDIRQSLSNNTFCNKVKNILTNETTSISIWGLEPNINGQYFQHFIYELLNFSPCIKYINIISNGSDGFYENFILPLINYSNINKRKLKVWTQISLDGPAYIMDKHCGAGSYERTMRNIQHIYQAYPNNVNYLKLRLTLKSTFEPEDWYTDPETWYRWRNNLYMRLSYKESIDCSHIKDMQPTLKFPYNYTKTDGEEIAKWTLMINGQDYKFCSAGIESKTVNYDGTLYDCHLLKNKTNFDETIFKEACLNCYNQLLEQNEILPANDITYFINAIARSFCWAVSDIDTLPSYLRAIGNGVKILVED